MRIHSKEKTLREIIVYNKSISRFGDGEYRIMYGENTIFQKYDKNLSQRLLEVLKSNEKNLLIGISIPYRKKDLDERSESSKNFWYRYFTSNKLKIARLINKKRIYYSSMISRFYSVYKDKTKCSEYIKTLKKIWDIL